MVRMMELPPLIQLGIGEDRFHGLERCLEAIVPGPEFGRGRLPVDIRNPLVFTEGMVH